MTLFCVNTCSNFVLFISFAVDYDELLTVFFSGVMPDSIDYVVLPQLFERIVV